MGSPSISRLAALALAAASLLVTPALRAAEGDFLFSSAFFFDVGGTKSDIPAAMAAYPDGRIIQFGTVATGPGAWKMAAVRFMPNGSLDGSFNTTGMLINPFLLAQNSWGVALHLLPNGSILVAGTVDHGGDHNFIVGRLDPNGTPDELFGVSGEGFTFETFNIGGDNKDDLGAMTVDRFGRIVVVGTVDSGIADTDIGVARFTAGGQWDDDFSGNGNTAISIAAAGGQDLGLAVAIDNQDRILVGGASWTTSFDWSIAALDFSGTLDPSFDTDGKWTYPGDAGGTNTEVIRDLDVWPNGEIVAAGEATIGVLGDDSWWVVKSISPTGGLPTSRAGYFCGDSSSPCPNGPKDSARSLLLQGDGKIVIGGFGRGPGGTIDFGAARLHRNLSLDSSFAGDGTTTYDFNRGSGARVDKGFTAAFDLDGRILVSGPVEWNGLDTDFGWVRFDSFYVFADGFDWSGGWTRWSQVVN